MKQAKKAAPLFLAVLLFAAIFSGTAWAEESKPSPYEFSTAEELEQCIEEFKNSGAKSRRVSFVPGSGGSQFVFDRDMVTCEWLTIDMSAADTMIVAEGVKVVNKWTVESDAQFVVNGAWVEYGTTWVSDITGEENRTIEKDGAILIHDGDRDRAVTANDAAVYLGRGRALAARLTLQYLTGTE